MASSRDSNYGGSDNDNKIELRNKRFQITTQNLIIENEEHKEVNPQVGDLHFESLKLFEKL